MNQLPVAILCGGKGTRLSEETRSIPKPMVEIGGKPILWHIMKIYAYYGFTNFVVAGGYKHQVIQDYFRDNDDDLNSEYGIVFLDTGLETQISGRIRRILEFTQRTTLITYGDGLADIDICELLWFHQRQRKMATVTVVHPPSRFGRVRFAADGVSIHAFDEKPLEEELINGGFMVLEPEILHLGRGLQDDEIFERVYLPKLARMGELAGYLHPGFWQCMDTLREKEYLNQLWETGKAPWKVWNV